MVLNGQSRGYPRWASDGSGDGNHERRFQQGCRLGVVVVMRDSSGVIIAKLSGMFRKIFQGGRGNSEGRLLDQGFK